MFYHILMNKPQYFLVLKKKAKYSILVFPMFFITLTCTRLLYVISQSQNTIFSQVSETNARSDMISDRLDEVHARQVARTIDRQTTSNADVQLDETPESG